MKEEKIYLGDGVYLTNNGCHLILTTEDGINTHNTIYLEPHMIKLMEDYLNKIKK